MTTFYLIRHATNDWVGKGIAGWKTGIHLNAEGLQQAESVAHLLARHRIDRLLSSPLERARETAEALARKLGLPVEVSDAIGEVHFGGWTGKTLAELEADAEWCRWNTCRSQARIPDGESMLELQTRMVGFLHRLVAESPGRAIALFSHGDPIRAALLFYLGMPLDLVHRIEISPASVSIVRLGAGGPEILGVNCLAPATH